MLSLFPAGNPQKKMSCDDTDKTLQESSNICSDVYWAHCYVPSVPSSSLVLRQESGVVLQVICWGPLCCFNLSKWSARTQSSAIFQKQSEEHFSTYTLPLQISISHWKPFYIPPPPSHIYPKWKWILTLYCFCIYNTSEGPQTTSMYKFPEPKVLP